MSGWKRGAAAALAGGVAAGMFLGVAPAASAAQDTGGVVVWGDNSYGQLNVPVSAEAGIVDVAAGPWHVLALTDSGSVVAWGSDVDGATAVPAEASSGVSAVAAGGSQSLDLFQTRHSFSLALKDGGVVAWGDNSMGQTDVPFDAMFGVVDIAAGDGFGLALTEYGSVVAWGDNSFGQTDVPFDAMFGVVDIAAGRGFALALTDTGSVIAWGANSVGQSNVPVSAFDGVSAIAAGGPMGLAVKDGSVLSWGLPAYQAPAGFGAGASDVAGGWNHGVALVDGAVVAYGDNTFGQVAVPAAAGADVLAVSAAGYVTAAVVATPDAPVDGTLVTAASDVPVTLVVAGPDGAEYLIDTASAGALALPAGSYSVSAVTPDEFTSVDFPAGAAFDIVAGESFTLEFAVSVTPPPPAETGSLVTHKTAVNVTLVVTGADGVEYLVATDAPRVTVLPAGDYSVRVLAAGECKTLGFPEGDTFTIVGGEEFDLAYNIVPLGKCGKGGKR